MVSANIKIYDAIAYYRLSKEDGDKNESNSITNQRKLIREFVSASDDIRLVAEMQDDGFTGTNFERPGFQEMLQMLEEGKADCVIVKDLSRLGRDYITTGKYIEKVFPSMGVRFIAINDYVDSKQKDKSDEIIIPFKNLINDSYCRELSNKLRRQFRIQRENGEFVSNYVFYGYLKLPDDKHKLIVDETAAEVVKLIFAKRLEGYSCLKIADYLNQYGILSPSEYKKSIGMNYQSGFKERAKSLWGDATVRRILTNRIYLGDLEQGKRSTPNYKVKKIQHKDRSEWSVINHSHEPIISEDMFNAVERLMKRDTRTAPEQDIVYPLSGILFCGDCHASMIRHKVNRGNKSFYYYHCSANKKKQGCSSHNTEMFSLHEKILNAIRLQIALVVDTEDLLQKIGNQAILDRKIHRLDILIGQKEEELNKQQEFRRKLYENMADGIITRDEYKVMHQSYNAKIAETTGKIQSLEQERADTINSNSINCSWMERFKENRNVTELSRELVVTLIDRIEIFEDKRIEITFNFKDELQQLQEYLEKTEYEADISDKAI